MIKQEKKIYCLLIQCKNISLPTSVLLILSTFDSFFAIITKILGKERSSIFIVDFYETDSGYSPVRAFLDELDSKKDTVKDARIQFVQVSRYIDLLREHGTANLSTDIRSCLHNVVKPESIGFSTNF